MKRLIIKAHPVKYGFTHKIAEKIEKICQEKKQDFFTMDLYEEKWRQDFLDFEDPKIFNEEEKRKKIQEKISWADEIFFIFPVWWGGPPAIVKNFLDQNFTSGFAFKYEKGKQKKLLKNKKVRFFATADSSKKIVFFIKFFMSFSFYSFCSFCGMKILSFKIFANMIKKKDDISRKKMLQKVEKILQK